MKWKVPTVARVANYWSMNTDTMASRELLLKRAIVAQLGLGANLPEDAIYPLNLADQAGKPLGRGEPVYDSLRKGRRAPGRCVLVHHPLRRGWFPGRERTESLRRQQLDALQLQRRRLARPLLPERQPGQRQGSELAARPKAPFNLTMRLYSPQSDGSTGKWNPPPYQKALDKGRYSLMPEAGGANIEIAKHLSEHEKSAGARDRWRLSRH